MGLNLDGVLRIEVGREMTILMSEGSADAQMRLTVRVKCLGENGRWREAIGGALMADDDGYFATRADALRSLARLIEAHDQEASRTVREGR